MAVNGFRVTSTFKIIIRICKRNFDFCGKTSKYLTKRCLVFFIFFHSNEEELIQQVRLTKYIENKISKYTSNKTKNKRREAKA